MKIKLNLEQIEDVSQELKDTDRKKFDTSEVSEIFRMLKYWSKTVGGKETKIKSVTMMADGYLCRVNHKFRDSMKVFLKDVRSRRFNEEMKEMKARATINKYDKLMGDAEEGKSDEPFRG